MSTRGRSKREECNELVEGLGLGLRALGVSEVARDKITVELAVSYALRRWAYASDYRSVLRSPKPDNEVWLGIVKSESRRQASVQWCREERRGNFQIRITHGEDWEPEEVVYYELIGDRPLVQWSELAELFLARLN